MYWTYIINSLTFVKDNLSYCIDSNNKTKNKVKFVSHPTGKDIKM
jgi:hypothetical protein